ncbi:hypothetical protein O181_032951 [Austropuccinia psidii MF-1]|uniref:Uncharacterized protein n=1 Tax=Austropuccinia psidii MF-1 TaxID=1389203 RepID=A0A9Q3D3E8_9BASI|nr:hypothetical protein [Austropuccinia psidii MF-1]
MKPGYKNRATYCFHSLVIRCNRAERDHKRLEEEYQAWLHRREERRQKLITRIHRIQASTANSRAANTLLRLQAELKKMHDEDNEHADRKLLEQAPSALPFQKSRKVLQKAIEERDADPNQTKDKQKGKAVTDAQHKGEPKPEENAPRPGPSRALAQQPASRNVAKPRARGASASHCFSDAAMAKGTARKFGMNYTIVQDEFVSDGWKANWGLHDVRACRYKYRSEEPKAAESPAKE